ncbi:hypothetical protein GCM10009738_66110 [Kitasatospora viridis]
MRRTAGHQTLAAQRLAVASEEYWEYRPDQVVMTPEGLPGTVRAVLDGPFPGWEEYKVDLHGGLGGGSYTASQLRPAPTALAARGTAADDYPELAEVLVSRPDPAGLRHVAAKQDGDSDDDDRDDQDDDDSDSDSDDGKKDDSDDDKGNGDDDKDGKKDDGKDSFPFTSMLVIAATDGDFRFQITAAWRDVVAKAKRIRTEGGVRVTLATDGLVVGEVRGDHEVYETGLQRLPGRSSIQAWSCGCKWGAYHWGASDDFSRFAGRMCSHALALTYEAQSRGMFGRDVMADQERPDWVPRHVVVKWDIDQARNEFGRASSLAVAEAPLRLVARAMVESGEDPAEVRLALAAAGVVASVGSPFGEPGSGSVLAPPALGATSPPRAGENPVSAGPLAGADPEGWSHALPGSLDDRLGTLAPDEAGAQAVLHDQPDGALPSTDGGDLGIPAEDEALTPYTARRFAKHALRDFTPAERRALIEEGEDVLARNLGSLQIEGTHYADLDPVPWLD